MILLIRVRSGNDFELKRYVFIAVSSPKSHDFVEQALLFAFKAAKIYKDFRSCREVVDKAGRKEYNSIVNSKGAADGKSAALFLVYSAKSVHNGVYDVPQYRYVIHPFGFYTSPVQWRSSNRYKNAVIFFIRRSYYGRTGNYSRID